MNDQLETKQQSLWFSLKPIQYFIRMHTFGVKYSNDVIFGCVNDLCMPHHPLIVFVLHFITHNVHNLFSPIHAIDV